VSIVEVRDLVKHYDGRAVVDGVSLSVEEGEIFAILGPNGAGKTTTVEIIEGLRVPDGGTVSVMGLDPQRDRAQLRLQLGAQLQASRLELYSSYYPRPADAELLLEQLGLSAQQRHHLREALRWPAAAPVDGAGAHRQPSGGRAR
jgi:ABC-2 type transport system ATP-binding protein